MDNDVLNWIKDGPQWLRFAAELQIEGLKPDAAAAVSDSQIAPIVARLKSTQAGLPSLTYGKTTYTSPGNAFWDLFLLADIGLSAQDIGIEAEVESFLCLQAPDGTFTVQEGTKSSYFCVPSILLASLAVMGYKDDPRISKFVDRILSSQRLDGGWHCAVARAVGGRLEATESCPMDNLNLLMLLGQYEEYRTDSRFNGSINLLLEHWRRRADPWRPYGFGIGSDFTKLRYPAVKYGILRVLDALSLYPFAVRSPEYLDMLKFALDKSTDGRYRAESVAKSYADLDFGQTKEPSRWITFLLLRIRKRAGWV